MHPIKYAADAFAAVLCVAVVAVQVVVGRRHPISARFRAVVSDEVVAAGAHVFIVSCPFGVMY